MKKILSILSILILILLSLSYFQNTKKNKEEGIALSYRDQSTFLPYSTLLSYKKVSFSTKQNLEMNGYDLTEILKTIDIPTSLETEFIFHSKDGGTLKLNREQNEIFYLVFQENSDGSYIRLVIPSDEFSQRWIKYLSSIEIK